MYFVNSYVNVHGIRVSQAEGIRCEWRGEADPRHDTRDDHNQRSRNAAYRLDYDSVFCDFNLCT